jgi:hypothetical protein
MLSQWDLWRSDGNPAESTQGRRIAMMDLHMKTNWLSMKRAKQGQTQQTGSDP